MAGTRRRSRGRSSSASDLEKRRSSSHSRRVRRRRRSSKSVTAGISVNLVGKERELRDSSTARKRERKGRSRIEDEEVSYPPEDEKERTSSSFRQSSERKRRAEDDEKPLLCSEDVGRNMKERRKDKDPQHQANGRRRRYSSGRSNSKYEEHDDQDTFSSRERGGGSSRDDSSSKYDGTSKRRENNNSRRHENSSSSNGKYDSSGKYGDDSSRSARGEDSGNKKYENYSSSSYAYNSRSRYVGFGKEGGDGDRKRCEANNTGSHGEGGSNRRENHSNRYVKSSSSSKYGMPISSGGYSESNTTARHSGGSTRYAKNCNGSSSGLYHNAYRSRDAIDSEHGRGRWRRLPPFSHAAGIQEDAAERRRRSRRSPYGRSGERDLSTGERTRAGRGRRVAVAAHEEERRGKGGSADYVEAASAETRGNRTAGAAGGSERRRRSLNVEEEGLYKRQRILHAAAATIGSRASFLRSNAPPGALRVGGSSAHEPEKVKEELGKETRAAGRRSSDRREAEKDEILQPLPRGGKRNLAHIKDRVNAEKSKSEEEWSKQQQQAHLQRKKEEEQQDQWAEWEQQNPHTEQQRAHASKRHVLQKNRKNTCSVRPPSGSRGACAASEKEAQQQQLRRGKHVSDEAGAERRDASSETRTYETRTPADEEMNAAKQKQEEQHQEKKEEQPTGVVAAEGSEGVRPLDKLCVSGHLSGGDQQTEATGRKSDTAAVCPGREREESERNSTQQKKQMNADLLELDGDKTATTAGRQDERKAGAAATLAWTSRAEDAAKQDAEAAAEREEGAARRKDKVAEEGEAGAGKVELAVTTDEAATRGGNEYPARHREEGKAAAGTGQQREEEILEAGGIEVAATEQSETRATKDSFSSTVRGHVQPAGDRSRDGVSTRETPAGEEEAEDSKASVDSHSLLFRRPPALTQRGGDTFFAADRRSLSAAGNAAEAERLQPFEKDSEGGAAVTDIPATAAAPSPPSPPPAQGKASAAEACEGGAALAEAEVSEGARASAMAQQQRGSRSKGEGVAGSSRSGPAEGEAAHADAAVEADAPPLCEPIAAGREEEYSTLFKGDSSFSAAVAEVAEEREQQQQQQKTNVEACEEMRTATGGRGMQHSHGSWRVVTLDVPSRNGIGVSSVKTRNRGSSSSASSSSSGERCREGAEEFSKKRRRDEEESSEKAMIEERRRIWYRMPASYPSPALQRHMTLPKYSQRPYLVPRLSSSSSSFSFRRYYSPSRPYSPSRDLSPGPSAARPAAYSKSDYRTVHFPSSASATAASFNAHTTAFPRTVVAAPPPFASHGSAAAAAARSRRGEAVLPLLQERSAAGISLGFRCGLHSTALAARVEAAPLVRPRLAQQQRQQQHERQDKWNPFPAIATVSSPLLGVGGRRPLGEAAVAKFGAAKDPRRKENFKWAHDLFEQVAREPEKTRRRFNLYSENLEIEE